MDKFLNHQINTSTLNQSLHQPALEYPASSAILFSDLEPIIDLAEYTGLYRAETSATADIRSPSTTSGDVQLSGEQSGTLTQGHLEQNEPKQKLVPVPLALRGGNEDDNTRITPSALSKRKLRRELVPIPSEYRRDNENEHTRISFSALSERKRQVKLAPVPPDCRRDNENEHTQIPHHVLVKRKCGRKLVPVPLEYRRQDENEHTLIRFVALNKRKYKKLKSTAFSGEKPHAPHHVGETSAANTLTDSNSVRQNSPIINRSPSDSNASPVPLGSRCGNEDDNTRIKPSKLSKQRYGVKLVSIPPEYRLSNEDEHTQISYNALALRKYKRELVPVPPEYRIRNEDEHTLIGCGVLEKRKNQSKLVPVPPEYRRSNEDEHTLISFCALYKRKQRKLKPASFSGEESHAPHQAGETSAVNTLTDSNSARQNSPILTRSPSGSNASTLHETTAQGSMETDEALPSFESETAFSHWLEYPASSPILFSDLEPIIDLAEYSTCLYRAETSASADLRNHSTTSGDVQLSGEHNSIALTQGHLEQCELPRQLVPVPPEYRLEHEDEHTRIRRNILLKRKCDWELVPVPSEYRLEHEGEHTRIRRNALSKRKLNRKSVPVPPEYRLEHEDGHTRISPNALALRRRLRKGVPVPPEYRLNNEDEHTRISPNALTLRKRNYELVPIPPEYRLHNEDENTRISPNTLTLRKHDKELVPVPLEYRRSNENEHARISSNALSLRKRRKLKSAALSGKKPHVSHQAGETSATNTLTDSNSARQNSPILTRSPSGPNASTLHEATPHEATPHETTLPGTMETDETLPPFESETAFSHWLDDFNVQQSVIDYIQNSHW